MEKVHFLLEWASPDVIGSKSLAVNLSDIAACGGRPLDAFISIAVPEYIDIEWLDSFYRGMSETAREFQVNLLGGDTTGSKGHLVINVALTGMAPADQVLLRHTARAGDVIVLTGRTGESAAGTELLLSHQSLPEAVTQPLIQAHLRPRPHVREGRFLAQSAAVHRCHRRVRRFVFRPWPYLPRFRRRRCHLSRKNPPIPPSPPGCRKPWERTR